MDKMDKSILSFKKEISTLRTGRANANMLDTIKVDVKVTEGERIVCVGWIESYVSSNEDRNFLFGLDAGARGLLAKHGQSPELELVFQAYNDQLTILKIPYTKNYIESNAIQITISYMAVFIISAIIITLIAKVLQNCIELVLLGWLNRLLGLLLGLLKGFLIISLFIFIIQTLPLQLDETDLLQKKHQKFTNF